jgi:hypothetical protein
MLARGSRRASIRDASSNCHPERKTPLRLGAMDLAVQALK